jgi:DNA-binding NarL/FixJ family response regulator
VLVKRLVDRGRGEKKDVVAALSDREQEVLKLMTEGRSNNGIAGQLYITPKAVEST